jgi:hypothetical protein
MAVTSPPTKAGIRIVRRRPTRRGDMRGCRPSLVDSRLRGDPWIERRADALAVCFDTWAWSIFPGSPIDVPSLNQLLLELRTRHAMKQ